MVPVIDGVGIVVGTVRSHIVTLAGSADVAVHNDLSVNSDLDAVALDAYFLGTPFAQGLVDDPLGRDDTVDGAVDLVLAEVGVHRSVMVQNLDLAHAVVSSVDTHRSPDSNTVVDSLA